jgi:hypothetical protein
MARIIVKSHPDYKTQKTQQPASIITSSKYKKLLGIPLIISIIINIILFIKINSLHIL